MMKPFLWICLLAATLSVAQQKTRTPKTTTTTTTVPARQPLLKIAANGESLVVTDKGKTHTFDFLLPNNTAVKSRFVKAQKELFYVRYDYTASARAQSYYMVGYRYYNGKIYLRRFANLKNRLAKWSGTTHFYQDKPVTKWGTITDLLATQGAEDLNDSKNIGVFVDRKPKGKMALINGIKGDLLLQKDEQFIGLLNAAMTKTGI